MIQVGYKVVVEESPHRIFTTEDFKMAGCEIARHGSWVAAPKDAYILGLKELPDHPSTLEHTHIYFAHAYKQQPKANELLKRFVRGNGTLLDLEYLCDNQGNRAVAFGYWAGFVGAALALTQWGIKKRTGLNQALSGCLPFTDEAHINAVVSESLNKRTPKVVVIGAYGRCGQGASEMCRRHNIEPTLWGVEETQNLDRHGLLSHDIMVNCALITKKISPFIQTEDISSPRTLSVISDVSCDQGSVLNPIPIIRKTTSWERPVSRLASSNHPYGILDGIAIDNLASILPRESSEFFAKELLPHLVGLAGENNTYWKNARNSFNLHTSKILKHVGKQTDLTPKL